MIINLRYYDNDYHYNNLPVVSQLTQSPLSMATNPEQLERIPCYLQGICLVDYESEIKLL